MKLSDIQQEDKFNKRTITVKALVAELKQRQVPDSEATNRVIRELLEYASDRRQYLLDPSIDLGEVPITEGKANVFRSIAELLKPTIDPNEWVRNIIRNNQTAMHLTNESNKDTPHSPSYSHHEHRH